MINKHCLTKEWILSKRSLYKKADPSIMERMIFALYLLEQLKMSGIEFIFKGGTSLQLLLNDAKRFSVDIDVVISPKVNRTKVEEYLSKIITDNTFIRFELDERRSYKGIIPKAHYKFIYNSVVAEKEQDIVLDILFEENHYPVIIQKPIVSDWLENIEDAILVNVPDVNSITGDKLTAFAPDTIGVPYKKEKEREIIKQLFDLGCLFDVIDNLDTLKKAFLEIAQVEIVYREKKELTPDDVLNDIINTGLIIAHREQQKEKENIEKFAELSTGIRQFSYFLYTTNFRIDEAQVASAKAAYLAAIILKDYTGELKRFSSNMKLESYLIQHPDYLHLNKKLKHIPNGALFYWNETIKLII